MASTTQDSSGREPRQAQRTVLLVDDHEGFARALSQSFKQLGFEVQVSENFPSALRIASDLRPALLVSEVRLEAEWIFDVCSSFRELGCLIVVATSYPSIATAIRAVREGVSAYVAKPVTAEMLLGALDGRYHVLQSCEAPSWPSLDRTIWEYINQVFVGAGSMSEAARRLHLDRRSLRRMLAKHPPSR